MSSETELPQLNPAHPEPGQGALERPTPGASAESTFASNLLAAVSTEIFGPNSPFAQRKEGAPPATEQQPHHDGQDQTSGSPSSHGGEKAKAPSAGGQSSESGAPELTISKPGAVRPTQSLPITELFDSSKNTHNTKETDDLAVPSLKTLMTQAKNSNAPVKENGAPDDSLTVAGKNQSHNDSSNLSLPPINAIKKLDINDLGSGTTVENIKPAAPRSGSEPHDPKPTNGSETPGATTLKQPFTKDGDPILPSGTLHKDPDKSGGLIPEIKIPQAPTKAPEQVAAGALAGVLENKTTNLSGLLQQSVLPAFDDGQKKPVNNSPAQIIDNGSFKSKPESGEINNSLLPVISNEHKLPLNTGNEAPIPGIENKLPRVVTPDNREAAELVSNKPDKTLGSLISNSVDNAGDHHLNNALPQVVQPSSSEVQRTASELPKVTAVLQAPAQTESETPKKAVETHKAIETESIKAPVSAATNQNLPAVESQKPVENKIAQLLNVLAEIKPEKSVPNINNNNSNNEVQTRPLGAAAPAQQIKEQELPMLPNLLRFSSVSTELQRAALPDQIKAMDPNSPNLQLARNQISAEAMSLKDMITGIKSLDPSKAGELGVIPGQAGAKGDAIGLAGIKSLTDLQAGLKDGQGLGAKVDATAATAIGIKGADLLDNGKGGVKGASAENALIPGDKNGVIPERKDSIDKKDESEEDSDIDKELILAAAKAGKVKDTKAGQKPDDKSSKKEPKTPEVRKKYVVREGDTLESIAENMLGDKRFKMLLEIVNRGYITYHWKGSVRIADLKVGQVIWLPTPNEVRIHSSLFFTAKNSKSHMSADRILQEKVNATATVEIEEIKLPQVEFSNEETDTQTVEIKASKQVNTQQVDIAQLLKDLRAAASAGRMPSGKKVCTDTAEAMPPMEDVCQTVSLLDSSSRLLTDTNFDGDEKSFSARLEKQVNGKWVTVANYELKNGRCVRYIYKANGARTAFYVNLPDSVARDMSIKDLSRNWKTYTADFDRNDAAKAA